jgi:hypothetical protein
MHTHEYSPRPRLVVTISLLAFLTLLLAACGALRHRGDQSPQRQGRPLTTDQLSTEGNRASSHHESACAGQAK